jgi:phosphoglycolate phosphatase-like HAD superfamily hydrolase
VGVTWGFGSRDELEAAGAAAVVDHPAELREVLAGMG